ncbi:MAG: multicopper oxidase domain-containing protein [Gammaproteobacteria bacterium]|nr:multicopper oxidase domain-containing protein [Gammaproteobacteria bacterium]
MQGRDKFRIIKFSVERRERDAFHLPEVLSRSVPHPFDSIVQTRRFDIAGTDEMTEHAGHDMGGSGMHTIDHKTFDLERIDEHVRAGSTEIWEFDNSGGDEIHPMHIHGAAFRVFDRIGGRSLLTATERGVKDTVLVMPGEKVRLLVTFSAHPGKFVFHCHNLEHEEDDMMLNYKSS